MKFSVRQILASALGAVLAALIASSFGVTGTVIGVAIGSAVATTATALVSQSIERGQKAVRQVVQAPEAVPLLRKLGATGSAGAGESSVDADTTVTGTPTVESPGAPTGAASEAETTAVRSTDAVAPQTQRLESASATGASTTRRPDATASLPRVGSGRASAARSASSSTSSSSATGSFRRFSWKTIAGTAAIVFALALLFITAVELISGKPFSAIFGGHDIGTSVKNLFDPSPAPSSPATTTTTPGTSSTSTTSPPVSSSTTTTVPSNSTSTTSPSASSTTTTAGAESTTTTSTAQPGP